MSLFVVLVYMLYYRDDSNTTTKTYKLEIQTNTSAESSISSSSKVGDEDWEKLKTRNISSAEEEVKKRTDSVARKCMELSEGGLKVTKHPTQFRNFPELRLGKEIAFSIRFPLRNIIRLNCALTLSQ